jgi:winged helix DNA-binding protein
VNAEQVRGFRLARHSLDSRAAAGSMVEVARGLCGVHAQLASSAELALWARVEGLQRDDVRRALEDDRSLVKTWAMRGTLHLLPADDFALYVGILAPRWDDPSGAWLRGHGVTREQFDAIVPNVRRALDAKPRTREELADRLAELAGPEVRERLLSGWGALLKPSAHRGDLCFGANRGRNVTFVRPDRWLGRSPKVGRAEAGREVVRRYLRAYGPATPDDLGRWLGFRVAVAKRLLASLADELVDAGGGTFLVADADALGGAREPRSVRLLPAFDPYVVGSRPRMDFVAESHERAIFRPQGWISPVVLVGGKAAGIWAHERRGGNVQVRVQAFGRLTAPTRRALSDETERLGAFLGAPAQLSLA